MGGGAGGRTGWRVVNSAFNAALGWQSFDRQFEPYLRAFIAAPLWCGLGCSSRTDVYTYMIVVLVINHTYTSHDISYVHLLSGRIPDVRGPAAKAGHWHLPGWAGWLLRHVMATHFVGIPLEILAPDTVNHAT